MAIDFLTSPLDYRKRLLSDELTILWKQKTEEKRELVKFAFRSKMYKCMKSLQLYPFQYFPQRFQQAKSHMLKELWKELTVCKVE